MNEEKNYHLTLENRHSYVFAHVKADTVDEGIAVGFLTETIAFCRNLDIDRLLLLREIPVMISDLSIYFASDKFLQMIWGIKIAIVNPFPELSEQLEFFHLVTTNRGADHYTFTNVPDAEAWLLRQ